MLHEALVRQKARLHYKECQAGYTFFRMGALLKTAQIARSGADAINISGLLV